MNINMDIVKQVENIEFFTRCGLNDRNMLASTLNHNFSVTKSLESIDEKAIKRGWDYVCLDAENDICEGLGYERMREWNPLVIEIKKEIMPSINNKIGLRFKETCFSGRTELISIIEHNILDVLIANSVNEYYKSEFFEDVFHIYKAGHLPCGWIGSRLYGKFKIY